MKGEMAAVTSEGESVLEQLKEMGFPEEECKRALAKAEQPTVDAAVRYSASLVHPTEARANDMRSDVVEV